MYLTTNALVLREVKYKEADKILTVLTENEGKLTVSARGSRRPNSRIAAASQLLTYSEMTLSNFRGRWTLSQAETIAQFPGLRSDIGLLSLGSYFAECLEAVSDEDYPSSAMLSLGLNSLHALSENKKPPALIKAAFELRLMCLAGYEPMLDACPICGRAAGSADLMQEPSFKLNAGFLHCADCKSEEDGISMQLCEASLAAMRHIISAPAKKIFSFALGGESLKRLGNLTEAYVTAQLERGFKTLDFWKSLDNQW